METALAEVAKLDSVPEAMSSFASYTTDDQLIALWLHGRSPHTQRYYRSEARRCMRQLQKPISAWALADLQVFADSLGHLSPGSRARSLSAVKSLLTFGHRLGVLPVNVGGPLRLPKQKDTLAERILEEPDVQRMLALEPDPRNAAILRMLYAGGLRVSELCGLCWRDIKQRKDGCQVTIFGKGSKTRHVLVSAGVWKLLKALGVGQADEPLFRSRKGGHLDPSAVWRIVRAAARRAGIREDVSCHWLRHAHASHALDRGAPVHLVQATLGHSSLATTSKYTHARPNESSGRYLAV